MKHILIISFWNPTLKEPGKGIFIHEQINAVCKNRNDVVFLEVNVISSNKALFSINLEENPLYLSKKISITIKSLWWKFIYLNPWLIYFILRKILYKKYAWLTFEIIHSNVIFPCAIVGHFLSKKYNSKHIISEHWSKAEKILKHPIYGSIALKTYRDSKA